MYSNVFLAIYIESHSATVHASPSVCYRPSSVEIKFYTVEPVIITYYQILCLRNIVLNKIYFSSPNRISVRFGDNSSRYNCSSYAHSIRFQIKYVIRIQ